MPFPDSPRTPNRMPLQFILAPENICQRKSITSARNWEDKNGNKRTSVEIVADNVSFCGSKAESGNAGAPASRPAPSYQSGNTDGFSVLPTGDDDAFPFGGADEDDGLPF